MNRDDMAALEQVPGRIGGVGRIHGEMATNRQQGQVRLVVGSDQLHVGENPRITGMVEFETVLEFNDIARRFTAVVNTLGFRHRIVVHDARAVFGMHHGHGNARQRLDRTALVEADQLLHRYDPQGIHCMSHVSIHTDFGAGQLGEFSSIAKMVAVTVGHKDQVDLAKLAEILEFSRRFRIFGDERIDDNNLAVRGGNFKSGLTVPLQGAGLIGQRWCHCKS